MLLLNIIEKLYQNKIDFINKFNLYKLIKEIFIKEFNKFTYYKINKIFDKLIKTKILIEYKKNIYKFNKYQKRLNKINVVYFD